MSANNAFRGVIMEKLLPDIYKIYRDPNSGGWGYYYFVKRTQENLFFPRMAKTASIFKAFDAIHAAGGIHHIYITDFHFAGKNVDAVAKEFGAPIFCSDIEFPKIQKRGIENLTAFTFERRDLEDGLTVIPTPGHTSGGVCYLLLLKKMKYLFTGDFLYFDGCKWIVGSKTYSKVKISLDDLKALEFDYLVGCGDDDLGTPYLKMNDQTKGVFFENIVNNFK
jgi:glyoxylase-like metal-dependent hydrolase (beta-lactamase superfamily II)